MRHSDFESRLVVAGLARRRPARRAPAMRFSLRSYLLGITAFAVLIRFGQLVMRSPSVDLPLPVHLWFFALWTSVILWTLAAGTVRWAVTVGLAGVGLAFFGLLMDYVQDLGSLPLLTIWSALYVFATFAHLGSGVCWFQQERYTLAAVMVSSFLISVVALFLLWRM